MLPVGGGAAGPQLCREGGGHRPWAHDAVGAAAGRLPAGLPAPALQSQPLEVANPLLTTVCEKLYPVPWAPGEAILLEPRAGGGQPSAFGFWHGPREYQLLVRQGGGWRLVTPARQPQPSRSRGWPTSATRPPGRPSPGRGPPACWSARRHAPPGLQVRRVQLFEAGCALMSLGRAERELRQARDFLGWMAPPDAKVATALADCQSRLDRGRAQLREQTRGLLDTYQALPEPRYALENLAFFSRLYQRSKGWEKIGRPGVWTELFYGRPEFVACLEARQAAQEALWAQRPATLAAETARVFGPQASFGAAITHGLAKFRRDRPFPEPLRTSYRLVLAREEHESFQVAVAALGQPVTGARVSVQWEGAGPHPEVTLRPVGYVETRPDPDNLAEYTGWWPDPLMPPGPVDVAAGGTQPVWGTVRATRETPAGDHVATVTVQACRGAPPEAQADRPCVGPEPRLHPSPEPVVPAAGLHQVVLQARQGLTGDQAPLV